jgi:hypothetical protein
LLCDIFEGGVRVSPLKKAPTGDGDNSIALEVQYSAANGVVFKIGLIVSRGLRVRLVNTHGKPRPSQYLPILHNLSWLLQR